MTSIYQLIAQWNLLSQGTTASPGGASTGDTEHPGGRRPPGGGMSGQDWLNRYNAAGDRGAVRDELEREIAHFTKSTADRAITETAEQLTARIRAKLDEGWTVREVSVHCRCTETRVRQAQAAPTPTDATPDIQALAAQGLSVRNIAIRRNVSKSTVHRALRQAA